MDNERQTWKEQTKHKQTMFQRNKLTDRMLIVPTNDVSNYQIQHVFMFDCWEDVTSARLSSFRVITVIPVVNKQTVLHSMKLVKR